MPEKLDRCVKALMGKGKSESDAYAVCQKQFSDSYRGEFHDRATFDPVKKTAVSVRDGVLEYSGAEIGMKPEDHIFTVYRSPATIANTAMKMRGLSITDQHVPLDSPAPSHGGFIDEAEMIDAHDGQTNTTIAIQNRLAVSDTLLPIIETERRELSLGYNADLVPHDVYDFEQKNIMPHHLAVVDRGRCGSMCSFIDRKTTDQQENNNMANKFHKAFCDQEGQLNLQQIVELATGLPEAIKNVPVDQLTDLLPALQEIMETAKTVMPKEEPANGEGEGNETETGDEGEPNPIDNEDEDMSQEEKDKKFSDAVSVAAEKKAKEYADQAIKRHSQVVEKARDFLPDDYKFSDKSTEQVMRDALATESQEGFADTELDLAFKMLKKPESRYTDFGDSAGQSSSRFTEIGDKELA